MIVQSNMFNTTILDAIEQKMGWFPMKHMSLRWMRRYTQEPASHGWFQDSANFVAIANTPTLEEKIDLVATLKAWVAGFKQDVPYFLDWLKKIADWLLENIATILELLSIFIPRNQMVVMA